MLYYVQLLLFVDEPFVHLLNPQSFILYENCFAPFMVYMTVKLFAATCLLVSLGKMSDSACSIYEWHSNEEISQQDVDRARR